MAYLQDISASQPIQDYAVGSFQTNTRKVGEFLAPSVPVAGNVGRYKEWHEKARFHIPNTLRALTGSASEVSLDADDKQFDCSPNGLNCTVDKSIGQDVPLLVGDAIDLFADIYGLAHLYETITKAKVAAGAGTEVVYDATQDPVDLIDDQIEAVLLAARCEMAGVLFGASAWRRFKNHPLVAARRAALDWDKNPNVFTANAKYMGCFSFVDTAPEGEDPAPEFLLQDEILIFSRSDNPSRRDPSFMKTFRQKDGVKNVRAQDTKDGRKVLVTLDWSADIRVTNLAGVKRINYRAP